MDEYEFTVRWKRGDNSIAIALARQMLNQIHNSGKEITSRSLNRIKITESKESIALPYD